MSTVVFNFQKTPLARTLGVAKYSLRLASALAHHYDLCFLIRDGDPLDALAASGVPPTAKVVAVKPEQEFVELDVADAVEIRAHHFQPPLTALRSAVIVHDFHVFHVPWKYPDPHAMQDLLVDCAARADAVVTEFPYTYYYFKGYTGLPANNLFWAGGPLLIDGTDAADGEVVENVRKMPGKKILYPAQLQQHKNHIALIQALVSVNRATPVSLLLTGTEFDSEYAAALEAEVAHAGLRDQVQHLGNISDDELLTLYGLVDLTVIPSFAEGGAYVPLEALSRGCPVATSDIASARYHLRAAQVEGDVVYFDPNNVADIADAIGAVLSNAVDRTERRPPPTLSLPTWSEVASNWSAIIDWLLGKRPRPFVQVDPAFRLVGIGDD